MKSRNKNFDRNIRRTISVNNQLDQPIIDLTVIEEKIKEYLSLCRKDAGGFLSKKSNSKDGNPSNNHLIPRFILKNFVDEEGALKNKLHVSEYKIFPSGKVKVIENTQGKTPNGYSVKKNFYTINEFYEEYEESRNYGKNHKYRVEALLGIIESNAAPIIKIRQQNNFYRSKTMSNPYYYPEDIFSVVGTDESKTFLKDTTDKRIVIAVFFAAQYIRSSLMYKMFLENKDTINSYKDPVIGGFHGDSFGDFMEYLLPVASKIFYTRAWRWIYSEYDLMIPYGTAMVPFQKEPENLHPFGEKKLLLPIGRKTSIIFLEQNSFILGHDEVVKTKSLALNESSLKKLLVGVAADLPSESNNKDGSRSSFLAGHPHAKLSPAFTSSYQKDEYLLKKTKELSDNNAKFRKEASFLKPLYRSNIKDAL